MIMKVRAFYQRLVKNKCKATIWSIYWTVSELNYRINYLFLSQFITGVVNSKRDFVLLWIVKEIKWTLQ